MPISVLAFLIYALLLLAGLGLTLGPIVEQATGAPVTLQGVVWMALIAAAIFSVTLVIQRKEAGARLCNRSLHHPHSSWPTDRADLWELAPRLPANSACTAPHSWVTRWRGTQLVKPAVVRRTR